MTNAVIIDDDPGIRALNSSLLKEYFSDKIRLVGEADSVESGINLIRQVKPELALLDIEIKGGTSFDILEQLRPYDFKLIFITAFNSYALKAIKFSAIDYIVKPINEIEFQQALQHVIHLIETCQNTQAQNNQLLDSYKKETQLKKIVLRTSDAIHIVDLAEVMYCKSDNSYTTFFLESGEKVIVSKSIRDFADMLIEYGFFRPHQSYLVNLNFVKRVDKSEGGFVVMKTGKEIPLSARQKKRIIEFLEKL